MRGVSDAVPWIVDATDASFEATVATTVPVLVDLWAPCPGRHLLRVTAHRWHTICVDTKREGVPSDSEFVAAAETLKLLADPTRLRVVWALLHGEHSVNELADHVGVRSAAVSQHLAKLRLAGLVRTRRAGNHIFYLAENEHIERLAAEALLQADHVVAGANHHHPPAERTA